MPSKANVVSVESEAPAGELESAATTVLPTFAELYAKLAAPFDKTYQRQIPGGRSLTYITTEQAITRLTEVVGPGWNWTVDETDISPSGDDVIVTGTLSINFVTYEAQYGQSASRSGIGGARVKKLRDGVVMDLGNDMKAAESSALKRAASRFGVGLYLYERSEGGESELPSNSGSGASYGQQGSYAPAASRPTVQFGADPASGNTVSGTITRKSANGVILDNNGVWFNSSKFSPVDLNQFAVGQIVTIAHPPGKTFIDAINVSAGAPVAVGAATEEMDAF